jgi:GAF domain-containing protein
MSRSVVQIPDISADPEYEMAALTETIDYRSTIAVPILYEGSPLGSIVVARPSPGRFPGSQVKLLTAFADQAAIGLQHGRVLNDLQTRTSELSEALHQQTATANVLEVISRSAFDLEAVLRTLIETAIQLCNAQRGVFWLRKGEQLSLAAQVNYPEEWVASVGANPLTPAPDSNAPSAVVAFTGEVLNVADIPNDPRFRSLAFHKFGGYRAGLAVPLRREGRVEGVMALSRSEPQLFSERQVALVQTFADQAVIAIENTRLFREVEARNRELAEALEQQLATSAILRVIAGSPRDIQPVLKVVAESAAKLCDAYDAAILLREGELLAIGAHHGPIPIDFDTWPISRDWVTGRAVADLKPVHVHDLIEAKDEFPAGHAMALRLGHRTILAVPLLRKGHAVGRW